MSSSQEQRIYQARPLRVLIIANARYKGGLSGGDAIYESFKKYWPCEFSTRTMEGIDFKPFWLCYCFRILSACLMAIIDFKRYDLVYSASDFLPDSLPCFIYRIKGIPWVSGFFLTAFKENKIHFISQKLVKWLIKKYADMVIVTNPTMYDIFPSKKKTWINGGIDLSLAGLSDKKKYYDAVFCGRIHPSKGIDELVDIWIEVLKFKPGARLAVIGDGDLGKDYIKYKFQEKGMQWKDSGIYLLGYMGNERFEIYKESKVVLYPTPPKYDHFSMAPVEAMACGCPMVAFDIPVMDAMLKGECGVLLAESIKSFDNHIRWFLQESNRWLETNREPAYNFAKQFDYQKQSLRVYNEIQKELYANSDNGM